MIHNLGNDGVTTDDAVIDVSKNLNRLIVVHLNKEVMIEPFLNELRQQCTYRIGKSDFKA